MRTIENVYYAIYSDTSRRTVHRGDPGGRLAPACKPRADASRYSHTELPVTCEKCLRRP